MKPEQNRALGAFVGLAVGDALGAPVEFKEPGEFTPVTDYAYSYVWHIPPGYWTDDTSMAICLAESIIHLGKLDPTDLLMRFARWYKHGENSATGVCFDIGSTTRSNIERFIQDGVATPAPNLYYQSGNGGIMRLAPVAVRWWRDVYKTQQASITQSITTHGSDECQNCARDLGQLLARGIQGQPVLQELRDTHSLLSSQQISNSGRASDTLMAAKWSVATTNSFEEAVCKAVNLGGDADTIGAVTGQIAGSIYGLDAIPQRWRDQLYDYTRILDLAEMLFVEE